MTPIESKSAIIDMTVYLLTNSFEFPEVNRLAHELEAPERQHTRALIEHNIYEYLRRKGRENEIDIIGQEGDILRKLGALVYFNIRQEKGLADHTTPLTDLSREDVVHAVRELMENPDIHILDSLRNATKLDIEPDSRIIRNALLAHHPRFQVTSEFIEVEAEFKKKLYDIITSLSESDHRDERKKSKEAEEDFLQRCVSLSNLQDPKPKSWNVLQMQSFVDGYSKHKQDVETLQQAEQTVDELISTLQQCFQNYQTAYDNRNINECNNIVDSLNQIIKKLFSLQLGNINVQYPTGLQQLQSSTTPPSPNDLQNLLSFAQTWKGGLSGERLTREVAKKGDIAIIKVKVEGMFQKDGITTEDDIDTKYSNMDASFRSLLKDLFRYVQGVPVVPHKELIAELRHIYSTLDTTEITDAERVFKLQDCYNRATKLLAQHPEAKANFPELSALQARVLKVSRENLKPFIEIEKKFRKIEYLMAEMCQQITKEQDATSDYHRKALRDKLWEAKHDLVETIIKYYGHEKANMVWEDIRSRRQQQIEYVRSLFDAQNNIIPGNEMKVKELWRRMPHLFQRLSEDNGEGAIARMENTLMSLYNPNNDPKHRFTRAIAQSLARRQERLNELYDRFLYSPDLNRNWYTSAMNRILKEGSLMKDFKPPKKVTQFLGGVVGGTANILQGTIKTAAGITRWGTGKIGNILTKPYDWIMKGDEGEKKQSALQKFMRYGVMTGGVILALTNPLTAGILAGTVIGGKVVGQGSKKVSEMTGKVADYKGSFIDHQIAKVTQGLAGMDEQINKMGVAEVKTLSAAVAKLLDGVCWVGLSPFIGTGWTFEKIHQYTKTSTQRKMLRAFYKAAHTKGHVNNIIREYNLGQELQLRSPQLFEDNLIPGLIPSWEGEQELQSTLDAATPEAQANVIQMAPPPPKQPEPQKEENEEKGEGETKPKKRNKEETKAEEEPPKEKGKKEKPKEAEEPPKEATTT